MDLSKIAEEISEEIKDIDFGILDNLKGKEDQWLEERRGKFTASEFVRLMGFEDKAEFPDGAMTYVKEKVVECLTEFIPTRSFKGAAMVWGSETETLGAEVFAEKHKIEVLNYGSEQELIKKGTDISCTPDGIIKDANGFIISGIETKCPESKTHLYYLENITTENFKKELTKYYWQIQGCMYVTGAKNWYFISFDPAFKKEENRLFVLEIQRNDDDINKLRRRLAKAIEIKNNYLKKYE